MQNGVTGRTLLVLTPPGDVSVDVVVAALDQLGFDTERPTGANSIPFDGVVLVAAAGLQWLSGLGIDVEALVRDDRLTVYSFVESPELDQSEQIRRINFVVLSGFTGENVDHLGFMKLARDLSGRLGIGDRSRLIGTLSVWQSINRSSAKEVSRFLALHVSPDLRRVISQEALECAELALTGVSDDLARIDALTGRKSGFNPNYLGRSYRFWDRGEAVLKNCFEEFASAQHIVKSFGLETQFGLERFSKEYAYEPYVYETFEVAYSVVHDSAGYALIKDESFGKTGSPTQTEIARSSHAQCPLDDTTVREVRDWDVFVSYARRDWHRIQPVIDALSLLGLRLFVDRNELPSGSYFDAYLEQAVERSKCVVGLWSKYALSRPWVQREARLGGKLRRLVAAPIEPLSEEELAAIAAPAHVVALDPIASDLFEDEAFRILFERIDLFVGSGATLSATVLTKAQWLSTRKATVMSLATILPKKIPAALFQEVCAVVTERVGEEAEGIVDLLDDLRASTGLTGPWGADNVIQGMPPLTFKPQLREIFESWKTCALLLAKVGRPHQLFLRNCQFTFEEEVRGITRKVVNGFELDARGRPQFLDGEQS